MGCGGSVKSSEIDIADVDIVCNICKESFTIDEYLDHNTSGCFILSLTTTPTCYCGETTKDLDEMEVHSKSCQNCHMGEPYPKPERNPQLIFKLSADEVILAWPTRIDRYKGPIRKDVKELIPHGERGIIIYGGIMKGDKYVGPFVNGDFKDDEQEGEGYQRTDEEKYKGGFHKGKYHGQGHIHYINGDSYEGEWENGEYSGYGERHRGEFIYKGHFKNGIREGKGTNMGPTQTYEGDWVDDEPCGVGKMTQSSGSIYIGEFRDGQPHGRGTSTNPSGVSYTGEYKDGESDGHGTLTYANGSKYTGSFVKGRREGYGRMIDSNGVLLTEGQFRNDEYTPTIEWCPWVGPLPSVATWGRCGVLCRTARASSCMGVHSKVMRMKETG